MVLIMIIQSFFLIIVLCVVATEIGVSRGLSQEVYVTEGTAGESCSTGLTGANFIGHGKCPKSRAPSLAGIYL